MPSPSRPVLGYAALVALVLALAAGSAGATPPGPQPSASWPTSWRVVRGRPAPVAASLARVERWLLTAPDSAAQQVASAAEGVDQPWRFALPVALPAAAAANGGLTADTGHWQAGPDGGQVWRLRIAVPGARSLSLGFNRAVLPLGARLWVHAPSGSDLSGPYTTGAAGQPAPRLFTALVPGDEIVVELDLPSPANVASRRRVELLLGGVYYGFRDLVPAAKAGSCQVDVVCPEADPWRQEVQAVATTAVNGQFSCSGALVNDTAGDQRPFFLTAYHCGIGAGNADTLVVYWNFVSPTCGQHGGGSRAQTQSGATFRARSQATDFALVELAAPPAAAVGAYYAGWDATGARPQSGVGIHHPSFDEKSISFADAPLGESVNPIASNGRLTHWRVERWARGSVEPGSSGSCFFDQDHRCVGVLTAGTASCNNPGGFDVYGKLAEAWLGEGTPTTSLAPWLDAAGTGVRRVDGLDPNIDVDPGPEAGMPGPCAAGALCLLDGRYELTASWHNQFDGSAGAALAVTHGDLSGFFAFTHPDNLELVVKLLDFGDAVKVFYGQLTNLEFELVVRETASGRTRRYRNGPRDCGAIDQVAFPAVAGGALASVAGGGKSNACIADATHLCLLGGRFRLGVDWRNQFDGSSGVAASEVLTDFAGLFTYQDPRNVELVAKVLDFGDRVLVLYGALSDLEYTLTVEELATGAVRRYENPAGTYCGGLDDHAF